MLVGQVDGLVEELFANGQFVLRLHDRIALEIDKGMAQWKHEMVDRKPDTMVRVTSLVEDIGDTMQQLVDIGLRQSLSTEFASLAEETLHVRSQLEELRSDMLRDATNRKDELQGLRKMIEEVRKRTEVRAGVERIEPSLRSKLSRTFDAESFAPSSTSKQEINIVKEHIKELRESHNSQLKHQEELSMSLKTKLEQNHQKLKKELISLATRCDSMAADRELFNNDRLEKAVKRQIDGRLQPISQSVEEHRRFFSCYQEQFSDLERSVKKFLECSLQTIWKVITEIRFQVEQLPYRQQEPTEEIEKKPQPSSAFGFLFG